jgi:hypothetical protein
LFSVLSSFYLDLSGFSRFRLQRKKIKKTKMKKLSCDDPATVDESLTTFILEKKETVHNVGRPPLASTDEMLNSAFHGNGS